MKKIISVFLGLYLCLFGGITATANNVIGYSTYSDIVTYINHFPIPSYNFDGKILVAAEDLMNYGFDVHWNEYKWSLTISRSNNNEINNIIPTFKPSENKLGKRELSITTTKVSVFSGNYQYSSFGGVEGKTLINIEDLRCINGVSVTWVPEINAMKVWVEDGLEMRYAPYEIRRLNDFKYYDSCRGLDTYFYWQWYDTEEFFLMSLAELAGKDSSTYVSCFGTLQITDVINANGVSILKNRYLSETGEANITPYFLGVSDYYLSRFIILDGDDLYTNTASEQGGLIKFRYNCVSGNSIEDTIRVNTLPR